jgi:hypothetical protein
LKAKQQEKKESKKKMLHYFTSNSNKHPTTHFTPKGERFSLPRLSSIITNDGEE